MSEKKKTIRLLEFFQLEHLQKMQDHFAAATGVASIITTPDGVPITKESGYCEYCQLIRGTEKGGYNCQTSDKRLGSPDLDKSVIQRCLSGGLMEGGTRITVGDEHIANWMVGQIILPDESIDSFVDYGVEMGVDRDTAHHAAQKITRMTSERFQSVCDYLYTNAQLLSQMAYENMKSEEEIERRKAAEETVRRGERFFEVIINNISDVIAILEPDGTVRFQNANFYKIFGWSEDDILGQSGFKFIHPDDIDDVQARFTEFVQHPDETTSFIMRIVCKDGTSRPVHIHAINLMNHPEILGILVNYSDISVQVQLERDKAEAEKMLQNQQKLEAIGTLASGVAHEINNPINGIMNYGQLIAESVPDREDVQGFANEIIYESKRIAEIVRSLLQFSRRNGQRHSMALITDIVDRTLSLIGSVMKNDQIIIERRYEPNLPLVQCRSQQIQQVLTNLITNARDALNEKYPKFHRDKKMIIHCQTIQKEGKTYLRTIVEDCGAGIPNDIVDRVFDPFFSTKGRDRGTGLGLSISYKIIEEHDGEMLLDTVEGEYTKLGFDLPTVDEQ